MSLSMSNIPPPFGFKLTPSIPPKNSIIYEFNTKLGNNLGSNFRRQSRVIRMCTLLTRTEHTSQPMESLLENLEAPRDSTR